MRAFSLTQWPWSLAHGTVFTQGTDVPWNLQAVCCFQGTTDLFSHKEQKVAMYETRGLKPGTLPTGVETPWLARAKASVRVSCSKEPGAPINL